MMSQCNAIDMRFLCSHFESLHDVTLLTEKTSLLSILDSNDDNFSNTADFHNGYADFCDIRLHTSEQWHLVAFIKDPLLDETSTFLTLTALGGTCSR